jgi:GntR family transcriptional regulator/MocR family aminotransferase
MLAPDQTRQTAVFNHLRHSILTGALPGGGRLPPSRSLAHEFGVARQTVVLAYERLAAEGYVRGRTGSGTYVATDLPDQAPVPVATPPLAAASLSARGARLAEIPASASARDAALGLLLAGGLPAPDLFPVKAWARCTSRVMKPLAGELSSYPPPQGLLVLREQIAAHLAATRGLVADPGCIVVTNGTQQALRTAADLLLDPGDPVWVEDPGYIAGRGALLAAGAEIVPVPSDSEGLDVAAGVRIARRAALLDAMTRLVRHATALAAPGGLHMVTRLPDDMDEAAAVRACRARDLAVSPLRAYYPGTPRMNGLVIGFAATPTAMANEVAKRLEAALTSVATRTAA